MVSNSPDLGLSCPAWVQFIDPQTRLPYYYNVETQQEACHDPEPEGELGRRLTPELTDSHSQAGDGMAEEVPLWRTRPARVQQKLDPTRAQYTEGHEHFNIWYGKYENDRFDKRDREPASTRCEPLLDSGWTEVDQPGAEASYFCLFFARGSCSAGHRCRYYHRVPTPADDALCDPAHDIFGRERFAAHRDDLGGVGSFNSESRSLFVADLRFDRAAPDAVQRVDADLRDHFGTWGEVESVRVIPRAAIGFVRYVHRAAAEFAKVAMASQRMGRAPCITVKWALDDPNPRAVKQRRIERQSEVNAALDSRIASLNLSESEIASFALSMQTKNLLKGSIPYPDTDAQFPSKKTHGPATKEEADAEDDLTRAAANMGRMNALLAKIGAMRDGLGEAEVPDPGAPEPEQEPAEV